MNGLISQIFDAAGDAVTGTAGLLTSGVQALVDVFVTTSESGEVTGLTIVGIALALGVGVGAIYFLFRLIKGWLSRAKG